MCCCRVKIFLHSDLNRSYAIRSMTCHELAVITPERLKSLYYSTDSMSEQCGLSPLRNRNSLFYPQVNSCWQNATHYTAASLRPSSCHPDWLIFTMLPLLLILPRFLNAVDRRACETSRELAQKSVADKNEFFLREFFNLSQRI